MKEVASVVWLAGTPATVAGIVCGALGLLVPWKADVPSAPLFTLVILCATLIWWSIVAVSAFRSPTLNDENERRETLEGPPEPAVVRDLGTDWLLFAFGGSSAPKLLWGPMDITGGKAKVAMVPAGLLEWFGKGRYPVVRGRLLDVPRAVGAELSRRPAIARALGDMGINSASFAIVFGTRGIPPSEHVVPLNFGEVLREYQTTFGELQTAAQVVSDELDEVERRWKGAPPTQQLRKFREREEDEDGPDR